MTRSELSEWIRVASASAATCVFSVLATLSLVAITTDSVSRAEVVTQAAQIESLQRGYGEMRVSHAKLEAKIDKALEMLALLTRRPEAVSRTPLP